MTRSFWNRLVLSVAVLAAPALMVGCGEEPAPAPVDVPAASAPGAPGEMTPAPAAGEPAPVTEAPK